LKRRYIYAIALAVAILDQLTKLISEAHIPLGHTVPVIGSLLSFTEVHNRGGAFGMLQPWTGALTVIGIAVVVAILIFSRSKNRLPVIIAAALACQLGGAIGNVADRIRCGYVIDFIDLHWWPVFNIADSSIIIGILLLAYYLVFHEGRSAPRDVSAPLKKTEDT